MSLLDLLVILSMNRKLTASYSYWKMYKNGFLFSTYDTQSMSNRILKRLEKLRESYATVPLAWRLSFYIIFFVFRMILK